MSNIRAVLTQKHALNAGFSCCILEKVSFSVYSETKVIFAEILCFGRNYLFSSVCFSLFLIVTHCLLTVPARVGWAMTPSASDLCTRTSSWPLRRRRWWHCHWRRRCLSCRGWRRRSTIWVRRGVGRSGSSPARSRCCTYRDRLKMVPRLRETRPAARGGQDVGITQSRDHSLANPRKQTRIVQRAVLARFEGFGDYKMRVACRT